MTAEDSLVTPEARAMIGRERTVELGEVTLRDIQRYAIACEDDNPLYFDEAAARATAYRGIIAPPNMLAAIIGWHAGPREAELGPDGLARSSEERVPLKVSRVMGGGQELEFFVPVRPGDRFIRTERITEITEREGRSGKMVIMVIEQTYRNQRGEVAVVCRSTTIVR